MNHRGDLTGGPEMVEINGKKYLEVVFCCTGCDYPIVRNSYDHDNCISKDGETWYCQECDCPSEEVEEDEGEEEEEEIEEEEEEFPINIPVVGLGWCRYKTMDDVKRELSYCKNTCYKIKGDKTAFDLEGKYCETDDEEVEEDEGEEEEEEDDEEEEGCSYNFYICRHCFVFGTDDPDCDKCGKENTKWLYQEANAALALRSALKGTTPKE